MKSNGRNVIVGGSSITDTSAWPTWATWLQYRYCPATFVNTGVKGLGNEAIILRAVAQAKKCLDPLIVIQLTNVDKWDWYVDNQNLLDEINQEKHASVKIGDGGFWSTGSHWPKWKQHYRANYYSQDYFVLRTVQMITWFQMLCAVQNWDHYIIFDSPIFSVTEQQLNTGQLSLEQCYKTDFLDTDLVKPFADLMSLQQIYTPGIIGYAKLNNFAWFTNKVKGHPGSLVHWHYAKEIVAPVLDSFLDPVQEFDDFEFEAKKWQQIFESL